MTFDYRHVLRAGSIRLGLAANLWAGYDPAIISPLPKPGHAHQIFLNLKEECGGLLPERNVRRGRGHMQMVTPDDLSWYKKNHPFFKMAINSFAIMI